MRRVALDLWIYPPLIAPMLLAFLCWATKWAEGFTDLSDVLWTIALVGIGFLLAVSIAAVLWRVDESMSDRVIQRIAYRVVVACSSLVLIYFASTVLAVLPTKLNAEVLYVALVVPLFIWRWE